MTPDDKTAKRLIVNQVLSPNSNASAVEQMRFVAQLPVFNGKYEFLGVIGSGGMGVVYKAKQTMLDKLVAIKMLNATGFSVQDLRRFQQEARAARDLIHPNLIMIRDFGITDDGQPYMVFDFIEGSTLADIIKKRGQLEIENALDIFIQVAKGLSHAHQRGVLHRDIKPSNIIISEGNREVKIVDFGIAKVIDETTGQQLTQTGEVFGTPLYMSPEQGAGKKLDERADLYSMGCVMFEALTAVPPLVGESAIYTIIKHQKEVPASLKEASLGKTFPASLEETVAKLLAKSPEDRYQTAKELIDDLNRTKSSLGLPAAKVVPIGKAPAASRPGFSINPISALITAITIFLGFALFSMARTALQTTPPDTSHTKVALPTSELSHLILGFDFSGMRITRDLVKELRNYPKLHTLNLKNTELVGQPLQELGSFNPPDKIASQPKVEDALQKSLMGVTVVDLSGSTLSDEDVRLFPDFSPRELNLDRTHISDQSFPYLMLYSSLRILSLNRTGVTDQGLLDLKDKMKELRILELKEDLISDRGLNALKNFPRLEQLNLERVRGQITAKGILRLNWCPHLTKISLSDSALLKPLAKVSQLTDITIRSKTVTVPEILQLTELPNLMRLTIYSDLNDDDEELIEHGFRHFCHVEHFAFNAPEDEEETHE
jgi:serine/threonine protein kinase